MAIAESLTLRGFRYDADNKVIPAFLKRHKATLRGVTLNNYFPYHHGTLPLLTLVKLFRDDMTLLDASNTIQKQRDLSAELTTMLNKDGALADILATPLLRVDIGSLVLKPQENRVVELE